MLVLQYSVQSFFCKEREDKTRGQMFRKTRETKKEGSESHKIMFFDMCKYIIMKISEDREQHKEKQ